MKTTIHSTSAIITLCCAIMLTQGCGDKHDHSTAPAGTAGQDAHAALHKTKYNDVLVEFPGHKYSMEIINDEATGLVTAFLTDAHFKAVKVDAKEVSLNFLVEGQPKTYTLTVLEQKEREPATFTLTDAELATLLHDGWQGEASASVEVGETPYKSNLVKLGGHTH